MPGTVGRDYRDIEFDTSIPQAKLDIEAGRRTNALPWRGQFSPELVNILLDTYAVEGGLVVDPFCGSGTTMIESSAGGWPSYGIELNPSAFILSRLYTLGDNDITEVIQALGNVNARIMAKEMASENATSLLEVIEESEGSAEKYIAEAIFLLTLKNGDSVSAKNLDKAVAQVSKLIYQLSAKRMPIFVDLGDSRHIALEDGRASTVLTSPPYVNVFNYHQNYRKAVELLGWEVLPAARAEFGSNRKHRQNRFLTVTQYAQDIGQTLAETARVVKPGGTSVWVVGRESNVRESAIPNPQIVYEMAARGGLRLVAKHERKFRSRYGALVYEDILVFSHPEKAKISFLEADITQMGREVGVSVLSALVPADEARGKEIEEAILKSEMIEPSPKPLHVSTKVL